jgi:hypothetical protein
MRGRHRAHPRVERPAVASRRREVYAPMPAMPPPASQAQAWPAERRCAATTLEPRHYPASCAILAALRDHPLPRALASPTRLPFHPACTLAPNTPHRAQPLPDSQAQAVAGGKGVGRYPTSAAPLRLLPRHPRGFQRPAIAEARKAAASGGRTRPGAPVLGKNFGKRIRHMSSDMRGQGVREVIRRVIYPLSPIIVAHCLTRFAA